MVLNGVAELEDGDAIILRGKVNELYMQCCDCGLWHRYDIYRERGLIRIVVNRLDGEPDFSDVDIKTDIRRGK